MLNIAPLAVLLALGAIVALLLTLAALTAIGLRRPRSSPPAEPAADLRRALRHQVAVDLAAAIVVFGTWLAIVGLSTSPFPPSIEAFAAAPALTVASALVVAWIGERTWPRPDGQTRQSFLDDRTLSTVVRGPWVTTFATCALATAVLLIGFAWFADGNTISRDFGIQRPDGSWSRSSAGSPYPGWSIVGAQLAALAVVTATALACAKAAVDRPAVAGLRIEADHALRRASTNRVFRLASAAALVTCAGDLLIGSSTAANVWSDTALGTAMRWGALPAFLLGMAALVIAVLPSHIRAAIADGNAEDSLTAPTTVR